MLEERQQREVEIVALTIDTPDLLQKMADQISADGIKPNFRFVSDPLHKVIDRYGLLNPNGRGWPHPTMYIIDRKGAVRWKVTDMDYHIRPSNKTIQEHLAKVAAAP